MGLMGLGNRIEANVNGLLARAEGTRQKADHTLDRVNAMLSDIEDGGEVSVDIDMWKAIRSALAGEELKEAVKGHWDITWDKYSPRSAKCTGGPYDGKSYLIPEEDRIDGEMILKGGHVYRWDGHNWVYAGETT